MLTPLSTVGISRYNRPETGWTKRRQEFDRNPHLTLRAFRVCSYVLSHADGFVQTERQIARGCGLSVNTVRAAVADLVAARYIAKARVREAGRWIGTAYAVSDTPFTDDELAILCPPGAESVGTDSERAKSARPKKTTPARETTYPQRDQPSGGAAVADDQPSPVNHHEESAMATRATKPGPEDLALFDAPKPTEPETRRESGDSAATVVAAYVDSHRRHQGGEPLQRDKGRVARDAAAMLRHCEATMEELKLAANQLGQTTWANIGVQVKIIRERIQPANPTRGLMDAVPASDPRWAQRAAAEQERRAQLPPLPPELARYLTGSNAAGVA